MASLRIAAKSGEARFKDSTFAAWAPVSNVRGLMQSAAATMGEIMLPVPGSTARVVAAPLAKRWKRRAAFDISPL
jgi:hypothetical protein